MACVYAILGTPCADASLLRITDLQSNDSGHVTIAWDSSPTEFYQVEATSRLEDPWIPLSGLLVGASKCSYTNAIVGSQSRFYRVARIDPEAVLYSRRASVTDPVVIGTLSRWVDGLRQLGLYDHAVYLATLQKAQNAGSGSQVYALKGPTGAIEGTPVWTDNGLNFPGGGWVSFPNPFGSPYLPELSLLAGFDSDGTGPGLIMGSDGAQHGPAFLAGGSASQGSAGTELFFDYTHDGVTPPPNFGMGGRRTFVRGNTGGPELALATFCSTNVTIQANMDRRFQDPGSYPPIWNNNPGWRLGARLDSGFPFVGTISLAAAFDVMITDSQFDAVRRLYRDSIGAHVGLPLVNVMIEGDSLSEESLSITWGELLFDQPNWKGRFNKRNAASGGQTVGQMLDQFSTQVLPYATQPGRNYLFIWGGAFEIKNHTANDAIDHLHRYWALERGAGYKVAAFTVLPYIDTKPGVTERRRLVNDWIRSASSEYDYLVDVGAHPLLQDPTDGTYYRPDMVHLWAAGNLLVAQLINEVIPNP